MILQALQEYYDRKANDPDSAIAPLGWEIKEIPYVVVLSPDGTPQDIQCNIEGTGKTKKVKKYRVPQGEPRSSGIKARLLWDNPEYVFGLSIKKKNDPKSVEKQEAFREKIEELGATDDPGIVAVKKFLALSLEEKSEKLATTPGANHWETLKTDSAVNVTFKLQGESEIVVNSKAFCQLYESSRGSTTGELIRCLVSGEQDVLSRCHTKIQGVRGCQSTGGSIVSFNSPAFCSYGKDQGANAPIGEKAVFAYTTAVNMMLGKGSKNYLSVGEASTIFWGEKQTDLEGEFVSFFAEPPKDNPDQNVEKVKGLYESTKTGAYVKPDGKERFYILGLSPNAGRIAIRFWVNSTVAEISTNIARYFKETEIKHSDKAPEHLSIFRLLVSTAVQGKSENIPPTLEGDLMRAILEGIAYPQSLLSAVVRRIRAEHEITYPRAALLKAFFNRNIYLAQKRDKDKSAENTNQTTNVNKGINYGKLKEIEVTLNDNKEIGYRLGRLFATLEKIQSEANPGINATIRDRFYGAASGTPVVVFPNLMRLKNHHLSKMESAGRKIYFERLLGDVLSEVASFPANLSMEQQGLFALGYYHQIQDFYTKKSDKQED